MGDQDSLGTPPPGDPGGDDTAPPLDDPGGGDTMDDKDKDNPHTDDDPPLSTKVHLGSSSANDSPGSRDLDTPYLLASSNSKASRFSPISVTMEDSLSTPPPGDPGGDDAVDNKDKDKDNP